VVFCFLLICAPWSRLACVQGVQDVQGVQGDVGGEVGERQGSDGWLSWFTPVEDDVKKMTIKTDLDDDDGLSVAKQEASVNVFPYTTAMLHNTNYAQQNTVSVQQDACPGNRLVFTTCYSIINHDPDGGYPFIRLYQDGTELNTHPLVYKGEGYCSQIDYIYPASGTCGTLVLRLGCFEANSCQMSATVDVFATKAPSNVYMK
jgi:hypothetical protein